MKRSTLSGFALALLIMVGCDSSMETASPTVEQELAEIISRLENDESWLIVAHAEGMPDWTFNSSGTLQSGLRWFHASEEEFGELYDSELKGKLGDGLLMVYDDCKGQKNGIETCVEKLLDNCDGAYMYEMNDAFRPFELKVFANGYNIIRDAQGQPIEYDGCNIAGVQTRSIFPLFSAK